MKDKRDDIKLWAKIYNDTFPVKESVEVEDKDIKEHMVLSLETPGGSTIITLDGEWDTNAWFVDLLKDALDNDPQRRDVGVYVYTN